MGLFSSDTKTAEQPYEKNPWEPQQPYLTSGFNDARRALDEAKATNDGIGDQVADLTPQQEAALARMMKSGHRNASTSQSMVNPLVGNVSEGLNSYVDNGEDIYDMAGQDRTEAILSNAERYADNPYIDGQIDAALGDVRTAFDRDKASINSAAAGSGNMNSTRTAALEARALDDAQDRAADVSSSMRGAAYDRGLSMASNEEQQRFGNLLTANETFASGSGQSFDTIMGSMQAEDQALQKIFGAGSTYQDQAQNEIEGRMNQGTRDMDLVAKYMGTVGGSYGGEGYTSKSYQTQSPFQTVLGGAATAAGMGWSPFG